MANKVILKVSNLTKRFGSRIAVNNVSFSIHEGEIFGFLGPNGAGKSTTMKMICGLSTPTRGEINVCGFDIKRQREKALMSLGAMIENPLMYNYMSAYDNLKYFASLYKNVGKKEILACARIVGLQNRLKDLVGKYSLGMRQRLGIAQSLLHTPKLLILDEPLSGLDPAGVKEMRDFLRGLAKNNHIAIMVSSHMLGEMEQLCDTVAIINNGELLEIKHIEQLRQGIEGTKQIRFKVDYPNFAGSVVMRELKLPVQVVGNSILVKCAENRIKDITKLLVKRKVSILGVEVITKSLEEIFMDIIAHKTNGKTSIS